MKRFWIFILCACLLLGGCADADESTVSLQAATEASLGILIDQAGMGEQTAIDLLSQLRRVGYSADIRMAFAQGEGKYRLWLADATVDVSVDENGFVCVLSDGNASYDVAPSLPGGVENPVETVENSEKTQEDSGETEENQQNIVQNGDQSTTELQLLSLTTPLQAGEKATLRACGKAGVEYSISVRYASGESTAQGLEPQIAGADGSLCWTFRVSARVAAGTYPVTVTGGGEQIQCSLVVQSAS